MEHIRNDTFDEVLDALDEAIDAFVDGRPEAFLACWTRSEEVSLAGGRGGPIAIGQAAVRARLERVSALYGDAPYDTAFATERVQACAGHDVAYVVQHERFRFTAHQAVPGMPEPQPLADQVYRATMTLRREHGAWCITHRHADDVGEDRTV